MRMLKSSFTIEEFVGRIAKSEQDLRKGKFKTQKELERISGLKVQV